MADNDFTYKVLRVDLTDGSSSTITVDPKTSREFIGGMGVGARLLYDEVPPHTDAYAPENALVFMLGPFAGLKAPGSGGYTLNFFGPITNSFCSAQAQGKWGARLRFAGWNGLIVTGASSEWVYLVIDSGNVEVRPADHLLGKNTWDTERAIKEECGLPKASVACIGQAGEHMVRYAMIENDEGHICSTNGCGAVMGSKKLKAIVVNGKPGLKAYDDETLKGMRNEWIQANIEAYRSSGSTTVADTWGTLGSMRLNQDAGIIPMYNYDVSDYSKEYPDPDPYSAQVLREPCEYKRDPCFGCPHVHCGKLKLPSGKYKGTVVDEPEYEGMAGFTYLIGGKDPIMGLYLSNLCDLYGLDAKEASYTIALAIECYEKGLINADDTDGIELAWGNQEAAVQLLRAIAYREGFGNVLAEGVKRAGEAIGGEAVDFGVYTKGGVTPNVVNMRIYGKKVVRNWSVTDSGTACSFGYPYDVHEMLGLCNNFMFCDMSILLRGLNAATGWDVDESEAMLASKRIETFLRALNLVHGCTVADDYVSKRFRKPMDGGPAKDVEMPTAEELHDLQIEYYGDMGWDPVTSRPYPATLRELGLIGVAGDLWSEEELAALEESQR